MSDILTFSDLQKVTGYTRQGDVERCLKSQKITFFWGKNGIWTTLHHLNYPGGQEYSRKNEEIRF